MHPYAQYFPHRLPEDGLVTAPLIHAGLMADAANMRILFDGRSLDNHALRERIAGVQAALSARGLSPGDRVAVMLNNSDDQIVLIYALILSGLVWVPINTKLRGPGLDYPFEHAQPSLVVGEAGFEPLLRQSAAAALPYVSIHALHEEAEAFPAAALVLVDSPWNAPLCLIYTSGTTGAPKGVVFTHRMMRIATEAVVRVADVRPGDRQLLWEPLCHIGGAQMLLLPFLVDVQLHVLPRFSASQFWAQCTATGATQLHYLGGILDILMQQPASAWPAHHSLRTLWGAGVSKANWAAVAQRFNAPLRECYGMTECSSFATLNVTGKPGSIGKALPWLRVELLDPEGKPVPPGMLGEIVLSSSVEGVFLPGYLNNPAATDSALREGRLHTGDMARADAEGDLFFVGRRTDSMRVRGENVSAWEVERVFSSHPAVHACAAVGVESGVGEQEILLYVQFETSTVADWRALTQWAGERLATFQQPRFYQAVDAFELTPSERIKKHLLPRDIQGAWDRAAV
ncbi:AMP-binding protein [Pseudomonas sp. Marseille-Q5115]|uniref:AMP-binding protein n=1 Tax=Pseudomonas sp. Marseille-Q5115 TaxID=2866593 RepID=UPI001CE4B494|nr:AMP-binding protein [Pseudomonas sp. Marseille-Q5115]